MLREENLAAFRASEQCDCLFTLCDRGRKQTEEFRLNAGEGAVDHADAVGIRGSRLQDKGRFRGGQAFEQFSIILEVGVTFGKHPPKCRNDFLLSTTEFFGRFAKQCKIAPRHILGTTAAPGSCRFVRCFLRGSRRTVATPPLQSRSPAARPRGLPLSALPAATIPPPSHNERSRGGLRK